MKQDELNKLSAEEIAQKKKSSNIMILVFTIIILGLAFDIFKDYF